MAQLLRARLPSRMLLTFAFLSAAAPALVATATGRGSFVWAATIVSALAAAACVERRLTPLVRAMEAIAAGDRYAALPMAGDRLGARLVGVAEQMRHALIEADARAVAQRSHEAELVIRDAGRALLTERFRGSVGETATGFDAASGGMRRAVGDLAASQDQLRLRASTTAAAAQSAARDFDGLVRAARAAIERIAASAGEIADGRRAADRTAEDLARADQIVRSLAEAARHIGDVSKLIQSIAAQTSMLALNATIEASRAGEAGRGFAVVAAEVKTLANQAANAASEIDGQIRAIRVAVEDTVGAIGAVASSVEAMAEVDHGLAETLAREDAELAHIGARAAEVAREASAALPDIGGATAQAEEAGRIVCSAAEQLLGRTRLVAETVGRFFADLDDGAIRVGILHSLSGTMTSSERPLQELLVMLIEQRNASGGLLGRPIEAVIMDPRSRPELYAEQARALLEERKVDVIFGCWTSASRKATLPVLERLGGLMFYPSQYEGEERSPNIVYAGGTPSQTAIPAVDFLRAQGARRFYLVGVDGVYPRVTNAILRAYLASHGVADADILERYAPADLEDWRAIGDEIRAFGARPGAAIVSTVSGDANLGFFAALALARGRGRGRAGTAVMSLSIGEAELPALAHCEIEGTFVAWNYLHAIETEENRRFIADWRRFKGAADAITNDAMEATWLAFGLWSESVIAAGSPAAASVRAALAHRAISAPTGFTVRVDAETQHLHKPAFVGRIEQGRIPPAWTSAALIAPEPWSPWLTKRRAWAA
jgi:urea transport system substrate-binding protein